MRQVNYTIMWPIETDEPTINGLRSTDVGKQFVSNKKLKELTIEIEHEKCIITRFDFSTQTTTQETVAPTTSTSSSSTGSTTTRRRKSLEEHT